MNAEEIADELIAQRPRVRPSTKRRHPRERHLWVQVGTRSVRMLCATEIRELQRHVQLCNERAHKEGRFCWEEGCPRCSPA